MRRRVIALSLAALSLLVAVPAGATAAADADADDGKVCVRSAILFGAGREYCVRWSES